MPAASKPLEVGDVAPDFALKDQKNNVVRLSDFRGQPVVIAFYPHDFSGTCTEEHGCFMDMAAKLKLLDAQVLGISVDSRHAHAAYAKAQGISYPLLADFHPKGEVGQAYGVYLPDYGYHTRWIFVIDPDGLISYIQKNATGDLPDFDELLEALEEAV